MRSTLVLPRFIWCNTCQGWWCCSDTLQWATKSILEVRTCCGEIWGATLRIAGKGRQTTTLHRPIQQLFPLETVEESDESELSGTEDVGEDNVMPEKNNVDPKTSTKEETRRWPSHIAAQVVRDRLFTQTIELHTTSIIIPSHCIPYSVIIMSLTTLCGQEGSVLGTDWLLLIWLCT